jgi:NAD dependent epimerase/dehydratase family enzyme
MPRAQPKKGKIMNIFIMGGLGFVGRHLSSAFLLKGHRVTAVGRRQNPDKIDHPDFRYVAADTTQAGEWQELLSDQQVVVNLAGKSIFTIWTEQTKRQIYDSLILTTRNLVEALPAGTDTTLCSTSAIGYYGDRGEDILTEDEPPGDDFLAEVG